MLRMRDEFQTWLWCKAGDGLHLHAGRPDDRIPKDTEWAAAESAERLREIAPQLAWEPQIWMGVSVENEDYLYRIDDLRQTGAVIKFLSLEPLLGPLPGLNLRGIDWVIVGGESGPGARHMHPDWVGEIRDRCLRARVPFFFKQWGGVIKSRTGRLLDGRTWDEMPENDLVPEPALRVLA
jgi:protein gp37